MMSGALWSQQCGQCSPCPDGPLAAGGERRSDNGAAWAQDALPRGAGVEAGNPSHNVAFIAEWRSPRTRDFFPVPGSVSGADVVRGHWYQPPWTLKQIFILVFERENPESAGGGSCKKRGCCGPGLASWPRAPLGGGCPGAQRCLPPVAEGLWATRGGHERLLGEAGSAGSGP